MDTSNTLPQLQIAVIVGSTRPRRRTRLVAEWTRRRAASAFGDRAVVTLVDIADYALPLLDEPVPAAIGEYRQPHTLRWAAEIARYDGFVFVTPEYNHSMPAALKNAIDFLFAEWNDKAAGFVSFGLHGGVRSVEHLRLTLAEVKVACVRGQVAMNLFTDFDLPDMTEAGVFAPASHHDAAFDRMIRELDEWASALRGLRSGHAS